MYRVVQNYEVRIIGLQQCVTDVEKKVILRGAAANVARYSYLVNQIFTAVTCSLLAYIIFISTDIWRGLIARRLISGLLQGHQLWETVK